MNKPEQLCNLFEKIRQSIAQGKYTQTRHALKRHQERDIDLFDALHVLKTGYHEKRKTSFDETHKAWKYAIRGRTVDHVDLRIVIAFDEEGMIIITVMEVL